MKPNRKQIEANLRNKMAAQYTAKVELLEKNIEDLRGINKEWRVRACKAEAERDELKDKVKQYEDWIERLQSYMGMSEEDRKRQIELDRAQVELSEAIRKTKFYDMYLHMMGMMV